jgi:molybdenum cofactor biosynthesis enzyme MoaA
MSGVTAKRRDRSPYSFANINLLGRCNVDCFFCLGKDLADQFAQFNNVGQHFSQWKNFDKLIAACHEHDIRKIYLTGQNVDALQYRHIPDLIQYLRTQGFTTIGCRTNGMLADKCWVYEKNGKTDGRRIVQLFDTVSYSVHTLQQHTQTLIFGRFYTIPDWKWIFKITEPARVRAAVVLNRYNKHEIYEILNYLASSKVDYIQVRKVCTDNRVQELAPDMDAFEDWVEEFDRLTGGPIAKFEDAPQYLWAGKKVSVWRTVGTSVNSLNYFTDGTLSNEYFVIEGYSKENHL